MPIRLQIGPQATRDGYRLLSLAALNGAGEVFQRMVLSPVAEDDYGNFMVIMYFVDKYRAPSDPTGYEFACSCYSEKVLDPITTRLAKERLLQSARDTKGI